MITILGLAKKLGSVGVDDNTTGNRKIYDSQANLPVN
jgi:hypothetical protein